MNPLLQQAAERADVYLESLKERAVAPDANAIEALSRLDGELPDEMTDPREVIDMLDRYATPATMGMAGPRFFGFVIGGSLPVSLAANWLATAWDQNTGLYNITPATARLEQTALRWLLDVLDLPRTCGGAFVTGATVANFVALAAARHSVLKRVGWNVEADGLFGAPPITVVVGAEAHPTLIKSLGLLGLGRNRVIKVPVDDQGRMRVDTLPSIGDNAIVCAQVGNVNTGACDAVADIRNHIGDAWLHVDGAFGLWARSAPSRAEHVRGVDLADSWATDAHKWLNVPYDCGLAFVRDADALRAAMAITAEYLPTQSPWRNPSDFVPELSRRARGVDVWADLAPSRPQRRRRNDRTELPAGAPLRRSAARCGLRHLERSRAQSGSDFIRRRRAHATRDRRRAGRRNVLVRRHGVARQDGDAHQRLLVGDDGCGCRAQHRRDRAREIRRLTCDHSDVFGILLASFGVGR